MRNILLLLAIWAGATYTQALNAQTSGAQSDTKEKPKQTESKKAKGNASRSGKTPETVKKGSCSVKCDNGKYSCTAEGQGRSCTSGKVTDSKGDHEVLTCKDNEETTTCRCEDTALENAGCTTK